MSVCDFIESIDPVLTLDITLMILSNLQTSNHYAMLNYVEHY